MAETNYGYAVASIRVMELSLFNAATLEQLMACKTPQQALRFLAEKGWGDADTPLEADAILTREREKTWETIEGLQVDLHVFDVLSLPKLYHNLKAAVKEVCIEHSTPGIFYADCEISGEDMMQWLRDKDYEAFPAALRPVAQEACETLLQTRDGQLCDVIVDRACLEAILAAGRASDEAIIRDYAESSVAVADIKIAARCAATGKSPDFMRRAMAPCASLDTEALTQAAARGTAALLEYLQGSGQGDAAAALKESPSAFERWCDNRIIETIRPQLMNPFTAGPLVAYVLARENEIKTVRIILSGMQNDLPEASIRERIREMYV